VPFVNDGLYGYARNTTDLRACSIARRATPGMKPPTSLVPVPVGVTVSSQVVHQHCGESGQSLVPPYV
jgi:hypothetical protein